MNFKKIVKALLNSDNMILDLINKFKLLKKGIFLDYKPGDWAIGLDDILILNDEISRYIQHREIKYLEIGSGFSTVAVSKFLSKNFPKAQIVSLEADSAWIESTKSEISKNLKNNIQRNIDLKFIQISYDLNELSETIGRLKAMAPFDVVFVDAPPDTTMPNARQKVIDLLYTLLGSKSTLIIHDTQRNDEMYAFESARHNFYFSEKINTRKGISILRFPRLEIIKA